MRCPRKIGFFETTIEIIDLEMGKDIKIISGQKLLQGLNS
jgi:hypothetical protein